MSSSDSDSSQASSDAQQRTVRPSNRRILDHDEPSSDSSSGEESEESSSGEEQRNFLDLEAEVSDEDSHGSGDDSDHESSYMGGMNELPDREELYSFPQFLRLPIELRHRIWDFVDPDLREPRRVFKLHLPIQTTPRLCEHELLERQTASARAVLSTHQESRHYALGFYPDEIKFGSGNSVRYRRETDVILVAADWTLLISSNARWQPLQQAMSQVKHMALEVDVEPIDANIPQSYIDAKLLSLGSSIVPHLDTFYLVGDDNEFRGEDVKWCVTDTAYSFHLQTEEKEPGVGEDLDYIFCWPDPIKEEQLGYVRKYIDETGNGDNEDDDTDNRDEDGFEKGVIIHNDKVAVFPMVQFSFDRGLRRYNFMKSVNSRPGGWDKNWDPQYDNTYVLCDTPGEDSELDEYESEGIDDSPIEDSDGDSDDDSGMVYHGGDSDDDGPDSLSGPVSYMSARSSPAQSTTMGAIAPANFSDPESSESSDPSSDDGTGDDARPTRSARQRGRRAVADSDEDSSDEDEPEVPKGSHQPRRTVVLDSDDDGHETPDEEQIPPKRRKRAVVSDSDDDDETSELEHPQPSRRRKREVLSDSDGDDESAKAEEPRPLKRQKRVAMSDSDSDDDDDDNAAVEERDLTSKQRKRIAVPVSDEDSADSGDDSATEAGSADDTSGSDEESLEEEGERPKKKPSLAERLNLFRSQVPAAPSPEPGSDADSDMAQLRNCDYDEPDEHSDDAADIDDMDEASANEAWGGAEGDSEGDSAW